MSTRRQALELLKPAHKLPVLLETESDVTCTHLKSSTWNCKPLWPLLETLNSLESRMPLGKPLETSWPVLIDKLLMDQSPERSWSICWPESTVEKLSCEFEEWKIEDFLEESKIRKKKFFLSKMIFLENFKLWNGNFEFFLFKKLKKILFRKFFFSFKRQNPTLIKNSVFKFLGLEAKLGNLNFLRSCHENEIASFLEF